MHHFYTSIIVPANQEKVFNFFKKPENLGKMVPPFMKFQLLTPGNLNMKDAAIYDYLVRVYGISKRWTTFISSYNPPHEFTDVQLKGPNAYWHHRHFFEDCEQGTRICDDIHYMLPFGPIGKCANLFIMKPIIKAMFNYRQSVIANIFGDPIQK